MATFTQADRVANKLMRRFETAKWMHGVGLIRDDDGYAVSLRAAPRAHVPKIAKRIDGVAVVLERRGVGVAV